MPRLHQSIRMLHNDKGFTLQELLITFLILAVLSIVGISSFSSVQIRGRDQKRKLDLQFISTSLKIYYLKNKRYPCAPEPTGVKSAPKPPSGLWLTDTSGSCTGTPPLDQFDTEFISNHPLDPINSGNFYYFYSSTADATTFKLCALLENESEGLNENVVASSGPCGTAGPRFYYIRNP